MQEAFDSTQLADISEQLEKGTTPEMIASGMNLSLSAFRQRLAQSGWVIATKRVLCRITPVEIQQTTVGSNEVAHGVGA